MIALLWNRAAGRGADLSIDAVRARLGPLDAEVRAVEVCAGVDPVSAARDAVSARASLVIAAGGDGTVSAVAGALAGTGVALGVLPAGTSNSFGRALGIPGDLDGALAILAAGHRRVLDVARCRTRRGEATMVLHASIGFHTEAVRQATPEAKQRWGQLAYVAAAIKVLGELPAFEVELDGDGRIARGAASAVAVANVAPRKTVLARGPAHVDPEDGLLDVTVVSVTSIAEAIATGVHLWRHAGDGDEADRDNVGTFECRRLRIATEPPMSVLIDGEDAGLTPLEVESVPASLVVLAPPPP